MNKMEQQILVVKRDTLFKEHHFQGFLSHDAYDFESIILDHYEYIKRGLAEEDPNFQQPIAYCLICNEEGEIFAYQRASKIEDATESRLHGKWSWGIGGHIDKEDQESHNPIYTSLLREVEEELGLYDLETITPLGYINDDSNHVGEVHFGLLYLIETNSTKLTLAKEIAQGSFLPITTLESLLADTNKTVEEWSRISFPPLQTYLQMKKSLV